MHRPEAASKFSPSSRRAAGRALDGPPVPSCRPARPCCPRPPELCPWPALRPTLSATKGYRAAIKVAPPGELLACLPSTTRAAAGAIRGCRGELRFRPAAGPNKPSPTFPCTYPSSPACPSPPQNRHLAGTTVAAATAVGRQRPHLAGPLPAQPSPGIDPQGPEGRSPPAPGRSRPPVRRNLAGPPAAGAWGPHCEVTTLYEGLIANQGYFCKHLKLLGACVKMCSGIVFDLLQKLVKSV
jgi:hypothetical protein